MLPEGLDIFEIGGFHTFEHTPAIRIQGQQYPGNKERHAFEKDQAENKQHHGNDLKPQGNGGASIDQHTEGKEISAQGHTHYGPRNNGNASVDLFNFLQGLWIVFVAHSRYHY